MSSALAMVLTAALAVPGNGPEKVSGEVEQGLDLRGAWEGKWESGGLDSNDALRVTLRNGVMVVKGDTWTRPDTIKFTKVTNEGEGKVRFTLGSEACVGIYRQQADRLSLCFCIASQDRPTSFRPRYGEWLLILHRVKPRK